jgi:hypothetical protein
MAQLRQENYSVDDSVVNIAFGTIAGGVFGAVGSAFSRVKPPKLRFSQLAQTSFQVSLV